MKSKRLLVTTAMEESWGQGNEHLLFLGEWCRLYGRRHVWSNRSHEVLPYHWANRKKLARDHDHLEVLYEKVLKALGKLLNEIHGIDRPEIYWRIILGPWLLTQIAIYWDRWESIRIAHNEHRFDEIPILMSDEKVTAPFDYKEFSSKFSSQFWNQDIYRAILEYRNSSLITYQRTGEKTSDVLINRRKPVKYRLAAMADRILSKLPNNEKVFFSTSYFDLYSLIKLSLKLRQMPRLHFEFRDIAKAKIETSAKRFQGIDYLSPGEFEGFLKKQLLLDIPQIYFEGYWNARLNLDSLHTKARLLFSANSYYSDDFFKIWAAEQVFKGKKLYVSDHGGAMRAMFKNFGHDEKIACKKIVWNTPLSPKQVQLSPNKLSNYKTDCSPEFLTIVGLELPLYSYRCQSGPTSSLILADYKQKLDFADNLRPVIKDSLKIKPYPEMGWNIRQRYADDLGPDKISQSKTLRDAICNSKIVVCTYPQTTFSEAMHSGVPVILLYTENYWELDRNFDELIDYLKKHKIIFSDPFKAASHINDIWEEPLLWWNDPRTLHARKFFHDMCGTVKNNWLQEWTVFFQNELKSTVSNGQ